jgi:hypothetical protein
MTEANFVAYATCKLFLTRFDYSIFEGLMGATAEYTFTCLADRNGSES